MRYLLLLALVLPVTAQSRDPWSRMKRFDENGDGKIGREEFRGPERMFDRFDADGDGMITEAEARRRRGGGSDQLKRAADIDKNGTVSKKEWDAYFDKMDENGDGELDDGELRAALTGRRYNDPAPKQGADAPKMTVARRSDGKKVSLQPERKPLVLVFGSWT